VAQASTDPASVNRFGGLSLGESTYLVNAVQLRRAPPVERLLFLRPDSNGFHQLPVWVDHQDVAKSLRQRFDLSRLPVREGIASCRVAISGSF
jgi:CRISPR-associated protein Cas5t